ncbi:splicing factor, proline- and glutamine-rich-like [Choloepus didactylus]|uniref:splicing factor, proline- and glutamine-rich-like n=1 Tax=Choloepus didactylus TaxID=27675 RepID=UPI00189EE4AE|nr:splicing factor, proline- and glutamine-rich-like [Choloepus didactylus]
MAPPPAPRTPPGQLSRPPLGARAHTPPTALPKLFSIPGDSGCQTRSAAATAAAPDSLRQSCRCDLPPAPGAPTSSSLRAPREMGGGQYIVHRLHSNRGGGHGSWAPARHPAPCRLQAPGLRPPRRRGLRGLGSELPAPTPPRGGSGPRHMTLLDPSRERRTWAPVRKAMLLSPGAGTRDCTTKHVLSPETGTCAVRRRRGVLSVCGCPGESTYIGAQLRSSCQEEPTHG